MNYKLLAEKNWLYDQAAEYNLFTELRCARPEHMVREAVQYQPQIILMEFTAENLQTAQDLIKIMPAAVILAAEKIKKTEAEACAQNGIILVPAGSLKLGLYSAIAMVKRLSGYEMKTVHLEEKLDEIRVIDRAKLVLISRLSMTEDDAHRYIEKTAMDSCRKRKEVAESIIRTYEN